MTVPAARCQHPAVHHGDMPSQNRQADRHSGALRPWKPAGQRLCNHAHERRSARMAVSLNYFRSPIFEMIAK